MIESLILGLHFLTPHAAPGFHQDTPGIYAVIDDSIVAGSVRNSLGRHSNYAGFKMTTGSIDVIAGAITGYPGHKFTPLLTAGHAFGPVRLQIIPPFNHGAAALAISVEYRFK